MNIIKIKRTLAVGAAGLALTLAACSSSSSSSSSSSGSGTSAATSAATSPTRAASPSVQAGPGGLPVARTVNESQPFTVTYDYSTGSTARWRITFDGLTCGSGAIFDPKVLAASAASMGEQPTVPRPQAAGLKFCLLKFSVVNESDSNQNWQVSDEATVNEGQDAYTDTASQDPTDNTTGTGWDAEQAYIQEAQPHADTSDFGLQPGASGVSWAVYEIPTGAKVTSVSVEASAYSGGAVVLIQVATP